MKVILEKKDLAMIESSIQTKVDRFVNKKAKELVTDFQENIRLRKYLSSLIRIMVREELDYALERRNEDVV